MSAEYTKPKVLIVGAGFGGLEAAKELSNKDVDVALVDKHNHHLFQPLLYQVATAALTAAEIATPIRHIMRKAKNVSVYMNEITSIDTKKQIAYSRSGRGFNYDYLVLATGARHSYFGKDEWADFAPGLKSIEDAREIRQRVLTAFEKAEMAETESERNALLNFVIIGAGPTGVEMAGAIAELAKVTLVGDFKNITPENARVVLIDAAPRILMGFNDKLAGKARDHLESLGVEMHLNSLVKDLDDYSVTFGDNNDSVRTRTIIWAAGVQASPAAKWINAECDRTGRIFVDEHLNVKDRPEIYAIGDTASHTPENAERPLPGVAAVAKQMGDYVAEDITRRIEKKERKPFAYKDSGAMATIGRNRAIGDVFGMQVSGFLGWVLWCVAHIYFLIGFRNRVLVAFRWIFSYITLHRGVRLIIGGGRISDLPKRTAVKRTEIKKKAS